MSSNVESVSTFNGMYVAFHRPNKNVYNIIQYNYPRRKWIACPRLESEVLIRRRLSTYMNNLPQTINVTLNISGRRTIFNARTTGLYLEQTGSTILENQKYVPILREYRDSKLSPKYRSFEHIAVNPPEGSSYYLTPDPVLWTLRDRTVVIENIPVVRYSIISLMDRNERASEIPKLPIRIAWLVAEDACKKGDTCPITMELLSPITASVTSCYHVFDTEAIDHWLTEHKTCPVCKQQCSISKAFV